MTTKPIKHTIHVHTPSGIKEFEGENVDDIYKQAAIETIKHQPVYNLRERRDVYKRIAASGTDSVQKSLNSYENILRKGLSATQSFNWDWMRKKFYHNNETPLKPTAPPAPSKPIFSPIPNRSDSKYILRYSFLERLSSAKKREKEKLIEESFNSDLDKWQKEVNTLNKEYDAKVKTYYMKVEENNSWYQKKLKEYNDKESEHRKTVDSIQSSYECIEPRAIERACNFLLMDSLYPEELKPKKCECIYNTQAKSLIVNYQMPTPGDLVLIKGIKYVQTNDVFSEVPLSEIEKKRCYESVVYQVVLRSAVELFTADYRHHIEVIVFNGYVETIDKSTGHNIAPNILSIVIPRDEFLSFNLSVVDPKECFRRLKGIHAPELMNLSPIAPIINLDKKDKRFVPSYAVIEGVNSETNIAAMDWEDFEHLIRELFEKEFSATGGEVRVTQTSRDGGVDAIAFDPDTIRGGKIVIQAKRYTNIVGIAAVRDLYGTVINEGAIKGILVTTSDFGMDSIDFVKDKPITLINGNNLLHLLERHGYKAIINIAEARKILNL